METHDSAHRYPRGRLLRLAAACPKCGSRPALRITDKLAAAVEVQQPETVLTTYQRQRRACGHVYEITAAAYQASS